MDNSIDLSELSKRESESIEWKKNGSDPEIAKAIVKTISAFANDIANSGGGYVVYGAEETQDENGFPTVVYQGLSANKLAEIEGRVTACCRDYVSPSIMPKILPIDTPNDPNTKILVFIVHASQEAHTFRDGETNLYYVRANRRTIEARNGILRELLEKKNKKPQFDRMINTETTLEDIDLLFFRNQLSEMGLLSSNKSLEDYLSDKEQIAEFIPPLVGKLTLDSVLRPKNFTLLMFGKSRSISKCYPEAYTILSIYPGKDKSETFAERKELTGSIIQQALGAIELLNLQCSTVYDKNSDKPNQRKYPERAVKEAVVNAIVHRNYEIHRPNRITVFSDRIEIESVGSLHWGVNKEKFIHGKASPKWRNQTFAYLFNKLHLSQSEGQGIPTIFRTMKDEGCPPPCFEIEEDSVTCILPAHPRHALMREISSIDEDINLRKFDDALVKITNLLEQDIYNHRLIDLLCEICHFQRNPEPLLDFLNKSNISFQRLSPNTLINIADALSETQVTARISDLAEYISRYASTASLELRDIEKGVIALNRLRKKDEVIDYVNRVFIEKPQFQTSFVLLHNLARALIDRAKDCRQTAQDKYSTSDRKAKAWDSVRTTLDEADRCLNKALDLCTSLSAEEYIKKDMEFLHDFKERSKKPNNNRDQRSRKRRN
ncbi:MAG: putative DNA binding domain-containing protein [Planctomycetaceae bacterium]|nr:putative DNA binding domain-containing protein [Planctomycetaceae bacterium]